MPTSNGSPPSSPYRNEIDALRERKDSLEKEIARLKEQTTQLEGLRSREQELERELAGIAQKLSPARRSLPMLDQVKVASPCSANWNEMLGDDRVRFCVSCEKNVYNLSAMPRVDAERLLAERLGSELCVRFYQRADGTIMTQDCPVGVKKKQRKKLAIAVAGAGAMALAATSLLASRTSCPSGSGSGGTMQGQMATPVTTEVPTMGEPTVVDPPSGTGSGWMTGDRADPLPVAPVMGSAAPPTPKTPPPPPPKHVMGRR